MMKQKCVKKNQLGNVCHNNILRILFVYSYRNVPLAKYLCCAPFAFKQAIEEKALIH